MTALVEQPNHNDIVETVLPKQRFSIDQLEAAVKRRIGWVDEVISPFARRKEQNDRALEAKAVRSQKSDPTPSSAALVRKTAQT
jgi:Tfp pilus assembly PilM family ATPase